MFIRGKKCRKCFYQEGKDLLIIISQLFKRQPQEMVKHTQKICRLKVLFYRKYVTGTYCIQTIFASLLHYSGSNAQGEFLYVSQVS